MQVFLTALVWRMAFHSWTRAAVKTLMLLMTWFFVLSVQPNAQSDSFSDNMQVMTRKACVSLAVCGLALSCIKHPSCCSLCSRTGRNDRPQHGINATLSVKVALYDHKIRFATTHYASQDHHTGLTKTMTFWRYREVWAQRSLFAWIREPFRRSCSDWTATHHWKVPWTT